MLARHKTSQRAGFSLPEVIISLVIIGILFASAFGALHQAMLLNSNSALRNEANEVIEQEIEYLRSLDWAAIKNLPAKSSFYVQADDPRLSTVRTVSISTPGLAFVKVQVTWTDEVGKTHTVSVITQCSEGGISA